MSVAIIVLLGLILFVAFVVNGNLSRIADELKRSNDNYWPTAPESTAPEESKS